MEQPESPGRAADEEEIAAEPTEDDEEPDEDEFDPFADRRVDAPPEHEGDDRVHEGDE